MFQKGDTADTKVLRYERRKWDEFRGQVFQYDQSICTHVYVCVCAHGSSAFSKYEHKCAYTHRTRAYSQHALTHGLMYGCMCVHANARVAVCVYMGMHILGGGP